MQGLLRRAYYALGPLGAGIILDVLDLATFGPVGVFAGALVGGYAGWILGEFEGLARNERIALAGCAAIYMTIPFTEPFPLATIASLAARFFKGPPPNTGDKESTEIVDGMDHSGEDDPAG
jgi:hypothetical protein